MAKFTDAFTGEKRELHLQTPKKPVTPPEKAGCEGSVTSHVWSNPSDDQCPCSFCGATFVFVQALKNMREKKRVA